MSSPESMKLTKLFCAVHGEYTNTGDSTKCPSCLADPAASKRSHNKVRIVVNSESAFPFPRTDEHRSLDSDPDPVAENEPCPLCDRQTPINEFRHEEIGEIWEGEAAVWAEEGICRRCFKEKIEPEIREWQDAEWLSHHFESWRSAAAEVDSIRVYDEPAEEHWLPEEERDRVLNVERTLLARRERITRSERSMGELKARYPNVDPPVWERVLQDMRRSVAEEARATLLCEALADSEARQARRDSSLGQESVAEVFAQAAAEESPVERLITKMQTATQEAVHRSPVDSPANWVALFAAVLAMAAVVWGLLSAIYQAVS